MFFLSILGLRESVSVLTEHLFIFYLFGLVILLLLFNVHHLRVLPVMKPILLESSMVDVILKRALVVIHLIVI